MGGPGGKEGSCTSILQLSEVPLVISVSTFAFVLACAAVICGAASLLICTRLTRAQESLRSTIANALRSCIAKNADFEKRASEQLRELQTKTPASLAAEVAELSAAVAKLAATQRRFAGKFHAERQHSEPAGNGQSHNTEVDDEIAAHLALQSAPPRAPGT